MLSLYIIFATVATVAFVPRQSESLNHLLTGKWTIYKYQLNLQVPFLMSEIEFFPDGSFQSEGNYFGKQSGTFKTDQDKFVVIMDTADGLTEWRATFNNSHLRLKCELTGQTNSLALLKVNEG